MDSAALLALTLATAAATPTPSDTWADIRQFGAVADDAADDTGAIEKALQTRRPVYIPPGTFVVKGVHLPSYSVLLGAGRASRLVTKSASPALIVGDGQHGAYGIVIRSVDLAGEGIGTVGISMNDAHEGTIEYVDIHQFAVGLEATRSWTNVVRSSRIYNNRQVNVLLRETCNDFSIETSQLDGAGDYGLLAQGNMSALRLTNTVVQNCGKAGVRLEKVRAAALSGGYFERNNGRALPDGCDIEAVSALGLTVSSAIFYGSMSTAAICLDGTQGAVISGCVVTDSGTPRSAVRASVGSANIVLMGNYFKKPIADPGNAIGTVRPTPSAPLPH